jgi:prephenate dehydrogenase
MTYYLLLSGDSEKDSLYETNVLGEESFETFYPSVGFMILSRIVNQQPELLESLQILDEQKNSHTVTEFLDKLEQWKIKKST